MEATTSKQHRRITLSGYLLGFALGGFFDGILLHQVLQWHHLLSGLEEARHDIRWLILTDGLFHLLMYAVAVVGLWLLWRGQQALSAQGDRRILANALLGFAGWHILDGVLSHWLLGIHRIRMDVGDPLLWDLLWLGAFGLVPLLAGFAMRRSSGHVSDSRLMTAPLALTLAVLAAGVVAASPSTDDGPVMVLFSPGSTPQSAMAATRRLGARVLWTDPSQQLWAVDVAPGGDPAWFYANGAILVSHSILPAGCLDWLQQEVASADA